MTAPNSRSSSVCGAAASNGKRPLISRSSGVSVSARRFAVQIRPSRGSTGKTGRWTVRPFHCSVRGSEESIRKLALEEVIKNFRIVDGMLAGKEWTFDHWTAVDAYLFWVWRRFGVFKIEIPPFPNYADHGERMVKRDSVKRALAFEREVQAQAEKAA